MSEQYTIKAVGDPREWSSERFGGRFLAYPCDLEDSEGKVHIGVEWSRKLDSDAPRLGDTVYGDIQGGQHGDKLKVDWDAMKGSGSGSADYQRRSNGKGGWQPDSERDPEKVARIARSHALTCAVRVLTANDAFNAAKPDAKKTAIQEWADWIEGAVEEAGAQARASQAANGAGGDSTPPAGGSTAPAPAQAEDESVPF